MAILTANGLSKFFGAQDIFSSLSFEINRDDKIALIGANGVGKTTLLRILCGLEAPDEGTVVANRSLRIGYLPQQTTFTSQRPLLQEMLTIFASLEARRGQLRQMERQIEASAGDPALLEQYGRALERFEIDGGYEYEERIKRVLSGLGLGPEDHDKPVELLSGGQKTRAQLAKLLLEEPNLLVLDEPTNYLDLAATEWLEKYLVSWAGSLIVVAHDRYFLDKVVSRVWEMTFGHIEFYRGNYTHYALQREERLERRRKDYEAQQEFIAQTEDFVRRFQAGQRSKEARGRLKRLERLERVQRPRTQKAMHLPLQAGFRSGNEVLILKDVAIGYPAGGDGSGDVGGSEFRLFAAPDLILRRMQRVALMGPNGSGKTTFVRTVLEQLAPLEGRIRIGANVRVGYLAQSYEDLDPNNDIIQEIRSVKPLPLSQARSFLGRFLFSGDDVFKPISALSGGEQGRVALAKLALQGANLLLLDEPTSHLDIASREVLETVLSEFNGTILFVSHDRYFVDALATHIWSIEDGVLRAYEGDYSAFAQARDLESQVREEVRAQAREREKQEEQQRRRSTTDRAQVSPWWRRKQKEQRTAELESRIASLESRLKEVEEALAEASAAQDTGRIWELGTEHAAIESELHEKLAVWADIDDD